MFDYVPGKLEIWEETWYEKKQSKSKDIESSKIMFHEIPGSRLALFVRYASTWSPIFYHFGPLQFMYLKSPYDFGDRVTQGILH